MVPTALLRRSIAGDESSAPATSRNSRSWCGGLNIGHRVILVGEWDRCGLQETAAAETTPGCARLALKEEESYPLARTVVFLTKGPLARTLYEGRSPALRQGRLLPPLARRGSFWGEFFGGVFPGEDPVYEGAAGDPWPGGVFFWVFFEGLVAPSARCKTEAENEARSTLMTHFSCRF